MEKASGFCIFSLYPRSLTKVFSYSGGSASHVAVHTVEPRWITWKRPAGEGGLWPAPGDLGTGRVPTTLVRVARCARTVRVSSVVYAQLGVWDFGARGAEGACDLPPIRALGAGAPMSFPGRHSFTQAVTAHCRKAQHR